MLSGVFLTLTCCKDDEAEVVEQKVNIVMGTWNSYHPGTDSLVMTRVFTYDYYSYFSYAEGKSRDEQGGYNRQSYTIRGNQLVLERYTQTFELDKDTLWITNSSGDQTTKYIKLKIFTSVSEK